MPPPSILGCPRRKALLLQSHEGELRSLQFCRACTTSSHRELLAFCFAEGRRHSRDSRRALVHLSQVFPSVLGPQDSDSEVYVPK